MSNPRIEELLAWMNGMSHTLGWDAIVGYDKSRTNKLLKQLYIERFDKKDHELPPVSGEVPLGSTLEIFSGLKFSAPRLSFETADLSNSKVTLTFDFIGGQTMTLLDGSGVPTRIDKIQKILPLNSPQLTMEVNLDNRAIGNVDHSGHVTLNIGNGDKYSANFVLGDVEPGLIGAHFKKIFEEDLSDDQKIFSLGHFEGDNDHLKPKSFEIRTMAAPGAKVKGAKNYSDGLVMLFVEVEGGSRGHYPGDDYMYILPVDKNGEQYTAAVLIGSKTLMETMIKPDAEADMGHGLQLVASSGGDVAKTLTAMAGELSVDDHKYFWKIDDKNNVTLTADYQYQFADGKGPLTLSVNGSGISAKWETGSTSSYWYKHVKEGAGDQEETGVLDYSSRADMKLTAELDESGVVVFSKREMDVEVLATPDKYLYGISDSNGTDPNPLSMDLRRWMVPQIENFLGSLTLPSVDTFLVRNLLFPGYHAMIPANVFLPGDLYLPGHLDPMRTTFEVTPLEEVIDAGSQQQFSTSMPVDGVVWSIRGSAGDTDIGTIDAKGLYKAPASSAVPEGHKRVIVTATGKVDGKDVMSSAMVTTLTSTISVAPIFQVCDPTKPVELTAEALQGVVPTWSLKEDKGGTLSVATGNACTYTPSADHDEPVFIETILVKNPTTNSVTEAQMLVVNVQRLDEYVFISEDSKPETGVIQLNICDRSGPVTPDVHEAKCTLLYGPGTLSQSGVYEAPAGATGFAVILIQVEGDRFDTNGILILPLPMDNAKKYTPAPICDSRRHDRVPRKILKDN